MFLGVGRALARQTEEVSVSVSLQRGCHNERFGPAQLYTVPCLTRLVVGVLRQRPVFDPKGCRWRICGTGAGIYRNTSMCTCQYHSTCGPCAYSCTIDTLYSRRGLPTSVCYMIWYVIYLLTAVGLTPGGSSTVHIYTQTIHRTTQWNRIPRTERT